MLDAQLLIPFGERGITMQTEIQFCNICKEDQIHDVGKKQATSGSGAYIRRTTSRCRKCGTKEIVNRKTG